MSPVLNTMLPIGNATAPAMAPLPVQALDAAAKPFELTIPDVALAAPALTPTPTAPAPAQIAPGKMLKIEGVTPADTALPADVIPARAIELLNASAMREEGPAETSSETTPAHLPLPATTEKPRWAFERYLPAQTSRPAKQQPTDTDTAPEAETVVAADAPTEPVVENEAVKAAVAKPVAQEEAAAEIETPSAPVTKPAKKQAAPVAECPAPQIVSVAVAPPAPVAIAAPVVADAAPVANATPTARPLTAKIATEIATPAELAVEPEAPAEQGAADPKAAARPEQAVTAKVALPPQEIEPASDAPVAVGANPAAREALPVWTRTKPFKADGYAFVRTSVKPAIEAPVNFPRSVKDAALDTSAPVATDAPVIAQADTTAQTLALDPRASDASLGTIDGAKAANPLNQLSHASHVAQRHLDLARDTQWLDGLARDIVSAADRSGSMSFRLSPANLGELDIALTNSDAGLSLMMKTSSNEATKIIAAAQPALVDTIQSQGVRIADAQVMSQADLSRQGQPQSQRQAQAAFIETGFAASSETETQDNKQPRGRFA